MPGRLDREADLVRRRLEHGDPYWPAQLAVATVIVLHLVLPAKVLVGPLWVLPSVEGLLLVALIWLAPMRATSHEKGRRRLALTMIGFVSAVNVASLALLVHFLVEGGNTGGHSLIMAGGVLWATNVLLFAVWYWEMDRGGPVNRFQAAEKPHPDQPFPDLLFPQMDDPQFAPPGWRPGFADYLYMSLTNATAFSPTDTMPLTLTAKATMGIQSVAALLTVGLVIARAVNILG
jgi:hypothetical protein